MRLALIAYEVPPEIGGMQEYAAQLAAHLSQLVDLTCVVRVGRHLSGRGARCEQVLTGDLAQDVGRINALDVDVVLGLNAGFAAAAGMVRAPMAVVANGSDFLSPWIRLDDSLEVSISRLPLFWRLAFPVRERRLRYQLRRGLRKCRAVVAISRSAKRHLVDRFRLREDVVEVVPPGVGAHFFDVSTARGPAPTLRVLTVSRLSGASKRKNIETAIAAMQHLKSRIPVSYTIVGDGDDKERLVSLARDIGVADIVTFAGQVSTTELRDHYSKADLFLLAPRPVPGDVEGFGIVYLEASAAGVPVLASRFDGCLDAVKEGENGWFVEDLTPEGIASSVLEARPKLGATTSARARAHAERFRWPAIASRVHGVLERVQGAQYPAAQTGHGDDPSSEDGA